MRTAPSSPRLTLHRSTCPVRIQDNLSIVLLLSIKILLRIEGQTPHVVAAKDRTKKAIEFDRRRGYVIALL